MEIKFFEGDKLLKEFFNHFIWILLESSWFLVKCCCEWWEFNNKNFNEFQSFYKNILKILKFNSNVFPPCSTVNTISGDFSVRNMKEKIGKLICYYWDFTAELIIFWYEHNVTFEFLTRSLLNFIWLFCSRFSKVLCNSFDFVLKICN